MLKLLRATKTILLPNGERLTILNDVSLTVVPGEAVAILGRSGSGKSTLLGILGLIDALDSGSYSVYGVETTKLNDKQSAKIRSFTFGFIYQRFCLLNHLNVYANIEASLLHKQGFKRNKRQIILNALERVELSHRAFHKPEQLSGGEQQRVAIARALAHKPKVILADEPTGSLDQKTGATILDLMLKLVKEGNTSLVLVTHDIQLARRLDKVVELKNGSLKEKKV